ncbi:MAG: ATP-grasp domain-containing protein, partial [Bacteroidia bacterium]
MKKIGILFGQETTFPNALIDRINSKNVPGITAEAVLMYHVEQGKATEYAVILDRISQDVPFYRAYLKNAALQGTQIINNPFWWSADEKFFNNCLAIRLGVPVPKTVLLPSNQLPPDTTEQSFRNLGYPLNWEAITEHIGFPAYMKPHSGGGWKHVYKVNHLNELFDRHREAGSLVMLLQEEIVFEEYYRCYCIGRKYVLVMPYEPRNPHELRYTTQFKPSEHMVHLLTDYVLRLNNGLGYDFNTVEFAVRDGVPYAIDFCNPAPDADIHSVGASNFEWVVEHAARYAIECALEHKSDRNNITWGNFVIQSIDQFLKNNQDAAEKNSGSTTAANTQKIASNIAEPKKRGRKPKEKTEIEATAIKAEPKKRGRKPKEKTEIEA